MCLRPMGRPYFGLAMEYMKANKLSVGGTGLSKNRKTSLVDSVMF